MTLPRLAALTGLSLVTALLAQYVTEQVKIVRHAGWHLASQPAKVSAPARSLRPKYPYSVIPGGVYSPAELTLFTERDAIVRDHYSDFDARSARLVTTTEDEFRYVSYRLGNRVYWTKSKLRIPKGEILLTDGRNFCRTRCGNRLSSEPRRETTAMEPLERVLSLPNFRPELLAQRQVEIGDPPPLELLAQNAPPLPTDERLMPIAPPDTDETMLAPFTFPTLTPSYAPPNIIPGPAYITPLPSRPATVIPNGPPIIPSVSAASEPSSFALFGIAGLGFGAFLLSRRRRFAERRCITADES